MIGLLIIIFVVFMIVMGDTDDSLNDTEQDLNTSLKNNFKEKEPEFYHPITGYKGTKSEMDTYITNREKKLNEKL